MYNSIQQIIIVLWEGILPSSSIVHSLRQINLSEMSAARPFEAKFVPLVALTSLDWPFGANIAPTTGRHDLDLADGRENSYRWFFGPKRCHKTVLHDRRRFREPESVTVPGRSPGTKGRSPCGSRPRKSFFFSFGVQRRAAAVCGKTDIRPRDDGRHGLVS